MFKLNPAPVFAAVVALSVPGAAAAAAIEMTFKHKGRTALDAWMKKPALLRVEGKSISDAEYLAEVVVGWSGVKDDDGNDVPFTVENLEKLIEAYPASGQEIFSAYVAQLTEARAKN